MPQHLENLKPGDFVSITARMQYVAEEDGLTWYMMKVVPAPLPTRVLAIEYPFMVVEDIYRTRTFINTQTVQFESVGEDMIDVIYPDVTCPMCGAFWNYGCMQCGFSK